MQVRHDTVFLLFCVLIESYISLFPHYVNASNFCMDRGLDCHVLFVCSFLYSSLFSFSPLCLFPYIYFFYSSDPSSFHSFFFFRRFALAVVLAFVLSILLSFLFTSFGFLLRV